jgi:uncharacterized membrane protein
LIKRILADEFFYILGLSVLLLALILFSPAGLPLPLQILRAGLGLAYALFAPGYCLQAAAFPSRSDLDGVERLALSFGLSLAIIPALALLLDRLPWRINLQSVSIGLFIVILLFSILALVRRSRLSEADRYLPLSEIRILAGWRSLDTGYRVAYLLVAVVVLIFGLTAVSIVTSPKPAERLTEFYLLGPEGKAESYVREGSAGQPLSTTLGIHNLEGVPAVYRVEVHDGQGLIGAAGPFYLEQGERSESPIAFSPLETGDDVEVSFLLFRDDLSEPYRTLRLFLNVEPPS